MKPSAIMTVAALGALLVAALSGEILKRWSRVEDNAIARVSWAVSGQPMTVRATVTDASGRRLRGYEVHIHNSAGGNSATTDNKGVAVIALGERDMSGVSVNEVRIVDQSREHDVDRGLEMRILIKHTNAFGRNAKPNRK